MNQSRDPNSEGLLLMVAGAKGAIGSTLAVATAALHRNPDTVLSSMTTAGKFSYLGPPGSVQMVGWDRSSKGLCESIEHHGVLPEHMWQQHQEALSNIPVRAAPAFGQDYKTQVETLTVHMEEFQSLYPHCCPVFVNLLPACIRYNLNACRSLSQVYASLSKAEVFPDISYTSAAITCGIPVINFTSNEVEIPAIVREAVKSGVPLCGRDGKTGQTYLKVVLASALKARNLYVDGWYSMNILGNADGRNLMEPGKAEGKLANKTHVLDEILGYHVGERYGSESHKVSIDYYPPRGDAKEAWDVIDFSGLFGLPMSIRLNLQCRDSILAAPLVLDLARWMAAAQMAGRSGPVPELGFYFKNPVGKKIPVSFQEQLAGLCELEQACDSALLSKPDEAGTGAVRMVPK
jgi:myo-inositol-1-phosphate synthase